MWAPTVVVDKEFARKASATTLRQAHKEVNIFSYHKPLVVAAYFFKRSSSYHLEFTRRCTATKYIVLRIHNTPVDEHHHDAISKSFSLGMHAHLGAEANKLWVLKVSEGSCKESVCIRNFHICINKDQKLASGPSGASIAIDGNGLFAPIGCNDNMVCVAASNCYCIVIALAIRNNNFVRSVVRL